MTVNRILPDLNFSTDFKVRDQALETLTRRIREAAVSTREALAPFAVAADPHQEAVIKSPARTIRMVAPAGAGKTQTISNRVLHRVRQGLNPARALLLILTTCNDGLIPHQRAEVEEERRLFYVAMTRASSNLVISYVQSVCSCKVQPDSCTKLACWKDQRRAAREKRCRKVLPRHPPSRQQPMSQLRSQRHSIGLNAGP